MPASRWKQRRHEQRHSPCRTTKWKRTRSGGTDIRQGPHHARRDNAGFIREGECFASPSSRNAAQRQMACFCDLRARRAGSFQQADQAFSANEWAPKLLKVMDGQKSPGHGGGSQNKAQGHSGHGRKRSRNGAGGIGTVIRAAPEAGFWVALRKCAMTLLLLCFSGCYHIFPALQPFRRRELLCQVWKTSGVVDCISSERLEFQVGQHEFISLTNV